MTVLRHILVIILTALAFDSIAQGHTQVIEIRPARGVNSVPDIHSSPVLISLDGLAQRQSRAVRTIRICGSCGDHNTPALFILIIKNKPLSIVMENARLLQGAWVEDIIIVKGETAKKYGSEAMERGAVVITFKKSSEEEVLAALPGEFRKLHNL